MTEKIENLRRLMPAKMATTKQDFEDQGIAIGYNQAIDDVVKLFSLHGVVKSFYCNNEHNFIERCSKMCYACKNLQD